MTGSPTSPGLILGGGASAFGNGEDDPNQLAQIYQNLLSGAGDIVSGLNAKVLDISSGAIVLAGSSEVQGGIETAQEVANNLSILGSIAAFCKANGIVVQVDADLTDGVTNANGSNALVDQWATAAAAVGLPIASVQDVEEIGSSQSSAAFANDASIEVNAVRSLIQDYASSSYKMTAGNLAVGDMEGGSASSKTAISEWWQAYDAAAATAGVQGFSFVTADPSWDMPWVWSESTLAWQAYLEDLSSLAASDGMSLNVDLQGQQTDTSSSQYAIQAEQNAAALAMLEETGAIDVANVEITTWQQLPDGVSQISSPTSSTNIAAEIDATYPLYAAGSITAEGSITATAPGQAIVTTDVATSIVPLTVAWDAADVQAGNRLGVVIIDQTGTLTATQHGAGTVSDPAANILVLSGDSADLAAELASIKLTEPDSGPDTIDVETFGTAGQLSDSQISVLALQAGQNPAEINATSNLQGWLSSSAFLNSGGVMTSETLNWSTTGVLDGTIAGATTGQSAFVKLDAVHEPLAEYGVQYVTTFDGVTIDAVADINNPAVDNATGIATAGGAANNVGQDVTVGATSLTTAFNPDEAATLIAVQSTTNTFNPVTGQLETSVDSLAPDPLTVVNASRTAVANAYATQFDTGGTQVVEYNTGNNPAWQAGWGDQFNSVTLTYDDAGKLVEEFFQGGSSDPTFTIDDVFDPNTGALWEEFQSSAPPPASTYPVAVADYATGPLYVTEFNTGDNPNWDYLDWGTSALSDTEVRSDFYVMQNVGGFFLSGVFDSYYPEFVDGLTLDLLNLPGSIDVNLNALGTVVIDGQTLPSVLSSLTAIDAAGATGNVTLTGLASGGSTLIGGNAASTIIGYGGDTIIVGGGISTIYTGSGYSTVLMQGVVGTATLIGDNNAVTVTTAGDSITVEGGGNTIAAVAGVTVTDATANTVLNVDASSMTTAVAAGDTINASGTADVVDFINGGTFYQDSANSSATLNGNGITASMNAADSTLTAVGNNDVVTLYGNQDIATIGSNTATASEWGNGDTLIAGNNVAGLMLGTSDTLTAGNAVTADLAGNYALANLGSAAVSYEFGFGASVTVQANGSIGQYGDDEIGVGGAYTNGLQDGAGGQLTAGNDSYVTQMTNGNTATVGDYSTVVTQGNSDVATLLADGVVRAYGTSDTIVAGADAEATLFGNADILTVGSNSSVWLASGATGIGDVISFVNGGYFYQYSAGSTATLNGNGITLSMNAADGTLTAVGNNDVVAVYDNQDIATIGSNTAAAWEWGNGDTLIAGNNITAWMLGTSDTLIAGNAATIDLAESYAVANLGAAAVSNEFGFGASVTVQANGSIGQYGDDEIGVGGAYTTGYQDGAGGQLTAGNGSYVTQVTNGNTATVGNDATVVTLGNSDAATLLADGVVRASGTSDTIVTGASAEATLIGDGDTLTVGSNSSVWLASGATGAVISESNSTVTLASDTSAAITGSGSIVNNGIGNTATLAAQNTMTIAAGASLDAAITGTGTIDLASGTLVVQQPVADSATFLLGGTATLDFVSTVAGGVGMQFIQPGGTMEAQAAGSFGAEISGFAAGDRIDAAAVLYGLAPTVQFNAGILTVTDGTHTDAFALAGSYTTADFQLGSDGHGGTAIGYV